MSEEWHRTAGILCRINRAIEGHPDELTASQDRDRLAGPPWPEPIAARLEKV